MRKLYFDVDGTILCMYTPLAKTALAGGAFERAVREAGVEELVCIGNYVGVVRAMHAIMKDFDPLGAIFEVCAGVFQDEEWFRSHTRLVEDPDRRAAEIDLAADWLYLDDLAEKYFSDAGREDVFREHDGSRIFSPTPEGDGRDVLVWLRAIRQARPGSDGRR
jgi:hypothetical protein